MRNKGKKLDSLKTGLVLGKFLPPHLGHKYLIDFAQNYVDELLIVVGVRSTDPIPSELRIQWMENTFPNTHIIRVNDNNPHESYPNYWKIWEETLRENLPYIPQYFFASEDYGWKLSQILGMKYVPVDHKRELLSISGTKIRKNPMKYWKYIIPETRSYFAKKICIYGPESTGKTILTRKLAKYFNTVYCAEYARGLLDFKDGKVDYDDIEKIVRGHRASEKALLQQVNKVLFSDTDVITTTIWSKVLFNKCPKWIYE